MTAEGAAGETARDAAQAAEQAGKEAHQSVWTDRLAQAGLLSYGFVHLALTWLAVQLALGDHSSSADTTGAMQELAQQPFGRVAVWVVAIGLFLLLAWQLLEAAVGHRLKSEADRRNRERALSVGKAIVYGALGFSALKVALGAAHSSGDHATRSLTARLMDLPAGQWMVVLVGLVILGIGLGLGRHGWTDTFAEDLTTEGQMGTSGALYVVLGRIGFVAKGAALLVVGVLISYAGLTHDPHRSGGLDEALRTLLQQPFGPVLLVVVALGIACFGLFCFAKARHLRR